MGGDMNSVRTKGNQGTRIFELNASVVLIGSKGSGKRSIGYIVARSMKRRFIKEDDYFKEVTGVTRQQFFETSTVREFEKRHAQVIGKMLEKNPVNCVIECGSAIISTDAQKHIQNFTLTNPVIYILRDTDTLRRLHRLAQIRAIFAKEEPVHRTCSNFEFYNVEDHSSDLFTAENSVDREDESFSFKLKDVKEDFIRFVHFILGINQLPGGIDSPFTVNETPAEARPYTHALMVRASDFLNKAIDMLEFECNTDALEYCVDTWRPDIGQRMTEHVSIFRKRTGIPIIFSADIPTLVNAHAALSHDKFNELYFSILSHGLRLGVEFLVIDFTYEKIAHSRFAKKVLQTKGRTKIIGQFLLRRRNGALWREEDCVPVYRKLVSFGCDMVRLLGIANSRDDNDAVRAFMDKMKRLPGKHAPLIAYNLGSMGRSSQVLNQMFTPVTHHAIRTKREQHFQDPHLTSQQAMQGLFHSYMLDPLRFFIIGGSINYTMLPAIYKAAFHACGMTHTYLVPKSTALLELDHLAMDYSFGGASITQPWRVKIARQLVSKSNHASVIGAVNFLIPLRADSTGSLYPLDDQPSHRNRAGKVAGWYGDNTDWLSISTCLERNISPRNEISTSKSTGLVIGAGGLARAAIYAMIQLGCRKIFIYNRTLRTAEGVARHFNLGAASEPGDDKLVRVLATTTDPWPKSEFAFPCMIVSCVPADSVTADDPPENFRIPTGWLGNPNGGVFVEVR